MTEFENPVEGLSGPPHCEAVRWFRFESIVCGNSPLPAQSQQQPHNATQTLLLGPIYTGRANPLMLLASCVNTFICCSVLDNLHACVARCSASCVNGT